MAAPQPPRRGRCTRGRGHHGQGRHPHALPAASQQGTGGAQDGADGAALSEAGPGKTGARTRAGGFPPLPPPPAALTRWRPTRPRPTPAAARQPPRHDYTPGGHAGDNGWQADARQGGGAGGREGGSPSPPPPRSPPPAWKPQERPSAPPEPRGRPPSPRRDRDAGGGVRLDLHTARPSAPSHSRGGRRRRASPHQRAGATRGPSLGAAHGGAPEQYGGRAPHDPPMTTVHSGRAGGGFRSAGPPRKAVSGPPLIPPHPGAAPRPRSHAQAGGECADGTRGSRMGYRGPPPRGGAGRPRRDPPPPQPLTRPQAAGAPAPSPRGRGDGPPSPRPREEPERGLPPRPSRRLPQELRRTGKPAPTRQDAAQIVPSEGRRALTGVVWGATPPMDRTTPVTPALLPAQGRQTDGTRQSHPPPYSPPQAAQTGGTAHAPPPPQPAPRHTNATDPPRGTQPPQGVQTKGTE